MRNGRAKLHCFPCPVPSCQSRDPADPTRRTLNGARRASSCSQSTVGIRRMMRREPLARCLSTIEQYMSEHIM